MEMLSNTNGLDGFYTIDCIKQPIVVLQCIQMQIQILAVVYLGYCKGVN